MRAPISILAGAAAVGLCLAACGSPTSAGRPGSTQATTSSSSSLSDAHSGSTRSTATAWPIHSIARFPFSTEPVVPSDGTTAYAVTVSVKVSTATSPQHIISIDLGSGKIVIGAQVSADSFLLSYGSKLYVVSPAGLTGGAPRDPWYLRAVSLPGMGLGKPISLGQVGSAGYAGPGSMSFQPTGKDAGYLWAGVAGKVDLIDPASGAVVRSTQLPASEAGTGLAAEPDGRYVDVSFLQSTDGEGEVVAVATATGAIVRTLDKIYAAGPPGLTGVPGGVWVSYRGGMDGTAFHAEESTLQDDTPYRAGSGSQPLPGNSVGMGEQATVVGGYLLLSDPLGVTCFAAGGIKPLVTTPFPGGTWTVPGRSWTPFAASGRTVYVTTSVPGDYTAQQVAAVTLPSAC